MPPIPMPVGAGEFAPQWRIDAAQDELDRLAGTGGYSEDPESAVRRTLNLAAFAIAGVSLAIERLRNQIFVETSHAEDFLPSWELSLQVRDTKGSVEERRIRLGRRTKSLGALTGIAIKLALEALVGPGNATYRFNTAAFLDGLGASREGIYQIAFEVPEAFIMTIGQLGELMELVESLVPSGVGFAIGRPIGMGFRLSDPHSLLNRDMLWV